MKLSEYARRNNITYRTAQRHWANGMIPGKQLATGTIVVFEDDKKEIKLYSDHKYPNYDAFYTYDNIPNFALSEINL